MVRRPPARRAAVATKTAPPPVASMATVSMAAVVAALLAGCGGMSMPSMPSLSVYRIDIQQGNVINQEQLAALEPGMEKRKVRFILGTPLVADAFNQDRWDYYYSLEKRGEDRVQRVVSVFFEDERLVRVGGDVRPAAGPIVVDSRKDELVTVPEGHRDEGLLAALTPGWFSAREKFRPPAPAPGQAEQAAGTPAPEQAPAAIEVSEEDARYLRELLDGFGAPRSAATRSAAASPPPPPDAQEPAGAAGEQEEEGLLTRWARRLGIGDDEPAPDAPPASDQPQLE